MRSLGTVLATVGVALMLLCAFMVTGRKPRVNRLPDRWRAAVWLCVPAGLALAVLGMYLR